MHLTLTETEIHEAISHCKDTSAVFIQSRQSPTRKMVSKGQKAKLSREIGKICITCDRIITKSSTSSENYNPSPSSFTIEHLFPFVLGGDNKQKNLMVAMCYHCNARRNAVMTAFIGHVIGPKTQRTIPESGEIPLLAINQVKRFVEWSISSVLLPENDQDREIQEIWLSLESFTSLEEKPDEMSILLSRLAELEDRIVELENTRWKKALRFINNTFQKRSKGSASSVLESKEKSSIETNNSSKETTESPKIKFTPEEFSNELLSQKKRLQPVTFTTLYARLIKEKPLFNLKMYGVKPSTYLVENCSSFLQIERKISEKNPKSSSFWINGP